MNVLVKFTNEQIERAAQSGVTEAALKYRLKNGWDLETAITTKPLNTRVPGNNKAQKSRESKRSDSWFGDGNAILRCPVPGCDHTGSIITKVHCRLTHEMEREEIKKLHGMPFKIDVVIKRKNREEIK